MNIIKYQALLTAIETGSLTKTAAILNYSQPAISHMIRSLEEEFHFPLLIRRKEKVLPTESALQIVPYLRTIVYNEESLRQQVGKINNIESGHINLGAYNSVMLDFLPTLIGEFIALHPHITINIIEGTRIDLDAAMKKREVDFSVVSEFDFPGCDFIPLCEDEMMAVVPAGHPLSSKEFVTPEELFSYPVLAMEDFSDMDFQEFCRIHNLEPYIVMRAKQETSLLQLIANNIGVGIIPSLYLAQNDPRLCVRRLSSPYGKRTLGIAMLNRDELSPACKEFIKLASER